MISGTELVLSPRGAGQIKGARIRCFGASMSPDPFDDPMSPDPFDDPLNLRDSRGESAACE